MCENFERDSGVVREAACAYVIALMAVYWCTEVLPLAVCMQYLKDTNMLFVGGLMVAVAVEHWNLHKRIALRVLLLVGVRPALLMLGFMTVTAFLSMWISNTATTAMMVPIVQAILEQLSSNTHPEPSTMKQRKSVSVQAELSNNNLSSVSPDIVESESIRRHSTSEKMANSEENNFLGENRPPPENDSVRPVVVTVENTEQEGLSDEEEARKRMSKGFLLCVCYSASIGGIATLTGTGPNLILVGQMNQLFPQNGDVINFASWFAFAFPTMVLTLTLAWFWLQFLYIGSNLRKTWACGTTQSEREQLAYKVIREEHLSLGPMSYAEMNVLALFILMVVLWFTRDPRFMDGWATHIFNAKAEFVTDASVSLFVAILLFIFPSEPPYFLCFWRSSDTETQSSKGPVPPLLTWQASGLSRWLGDQMTPLHSVPPWAIAIILCLLIATFTECASNVATATLFLPVLASLSRSICLNPLYVMIPCTLSASFAFMLPVATPPNAIVFSYGYLKVSDMAKTGVVMNIIGIGCITLAINSWGRVMFDLDSFPSWANATAPV
ncbi:hypothetical protein fugu_008941 [Takifugu bimaculatus]|uniref:Solute carrier family 13 member 5 n=1 Tax=Takifugu bimaculatus TaxID=433685 RepID=A0A4Z2AX64_9TELE|nr:hypothetical protein fugu_008941 [Takifugu bimaculatus]